MGGGMFIVPGGASPNFLESPFFLLLDRRDLPVI
jgi:hypothetical protein